jgi:methylglutaconyl-CoA hydratase
MNYIEVNREGAIARVFLNRPEKRNPLSASMVSELRRSLEDLAGRPEIRVVILTGRGSTFSAGADLAELDAMRTASMRDHASSSFALARLFDQIRLHPKPIVARVNGHAIAGGCGLALACDFAVAADHAKLGFTEVRIGFVPAIVSMLVRESLIDRHMRDLMLTGRLIDAGKAARIGLLTRAVDASVLDDVVDELTKSIVQETSGSAVALTKRLLAATRGLPQASAFRFLSAFNALARSTDDCREGVSAFLDKRDPSWK